MCEAGDGIKPTESWNPSCLRHVGDLNGLFVDLGRSPRPRDFEVGDLGFFVDLGLRGAHLRLRDCRDLGAGRRRQLLLLRRRGGCNLPLELTRRQPRAGRPWVGWGLNLAEADRRDQGGAGAPAW